MSNSREAEKMDAICPECGTKQEVLWFPKHFRVRQVKGTTGHTGWAFSSKKQEKVEGNCKKCGYKFKSDDLD